ncbi:MAG: C13 family peptidase [Thiohalocapsa sp.]
MPLRRTSMLFLALALAFAVSQGFAAATASAGWQAVLVAGDNAEPVFDNAVTAMAQWLTQRGVPPAGIHRLSAGRAVSDPMVEPATVERVLGRIAAMHPAAGDGCFVFITSHGQRGEGVWLAASSDFLQPGALANALSAGCGGAPTAVIVSSCYSGAFARPPMRAANRVILTAARGDRPSFGCQANRTYTVFDECLLGSLSRASTWRSLYNVNAACVRQREHALGVLPSQPQAAFGSAVHNLSLR